ncbi:MAG: aminotransferase class V-fold PLP-dependent enzyme [Desulfobacteraceae bacterium]|jgi:glutamate/tyrosine decarboxylase-like PLP-dependent enzyme
MKDMSRKLTIPKNGLDRKRLLKQMSALKANDADWRNGRSWSLVYHGGDEHTRFLKAAYNRYFSENGLSPTAFPSLKKFETEVVAMMLALLGANGDEVGAMTSGGTESILLAVKTYRDWARAHRPEVIRPEILVPESAHPAFLKAAQYFDVKAVRVALDDQFRADVKAIAKLCNDQTICIIASAPSFPQGVVDPVAHMGAFAATRKIGLHVDACLGGFMLPFLGRLGYPVPAFDFQVAGVTSISADLHKYGYAAKGASAVLYRSAELRRFQFFVATDWPGGLYGSPTMAGTRPGGAIAAAWAALMSLGEAGYLKLAEQTMAVTRQLMHGIEAIEGFYIIGRPDMSVFTFTSADLDIFAVSDRMLAKGWRLDRQKNPDCLHMIVTPNHEQAVKPFLADLREAAEQVRRKPLSDGQKQHAMLYGVTADVPADGDLQSYLYAHMDNLYQT